MTAREVARALVVIEVPLARACAHFCDARAWEDCGYARQSDVSREVLGRSPRWLRQQAALGRALVAMPLLEHAMLGVDGGVPLGVVAASTIASVADADTVAAWVTRARAVSVRQLLADARHARASAEAAARDERMRPRGVQRAPAGDRHWVAITAPEAVHQAFDETLDLHAAVCGHEQTAASLIEAMVAGAEAGEGIIEGTPSRDVGRAAMEEWALVHPASPASPGAPAPPALDDDGSEPAQEPGAWLRRRCIGEGEVAAEGRAFVAMVERALAGVGAPRAATAAKGTLDDPIAQLRALLEAKHAGEVILAECLHALRTLYALRGRDLETFAVEHVGVSGAQARKLLSIADAAGRWAGLGEAWRQGEVSSEQALLLGREFGRGGHDDESVARWVADARTITVRRLRDHVRLVAREHALGELGPAPGPAPRPPADEAWFASLHRQPGMTAARIRHLVTFAAEHGSRLRQRRRYFVLERELARRFESVLLRRARWARDQGLPHWMGLVTLLIEYATEHDRGPRRPVLERDGYRCAVPGCTSRANLDQHHIRFRSAGGGDEPANRVTLCEYHHHRGVHGDLLRVRGQALAGLVFGVGRRGRRVRWYKADRALPSWQAECDA